MRLSLVKYGGRVARGSLAEWTGTLPGEQRAQLRAIAIALARDEAAVEEIETWLVLGHAAIHAWACAERQIAELKGLVEPSGVPGSGRRGRTLRTTM